MDSVKVNKNELLGKLQTNREQHRKIFLKAQDGYRKAVVAELEVMLVEARGGARIRRMIQLVEPLDQTKDYDRAIAMLKMSVDQELTISEHEFQQYVLDDWSWSNQFASSTSGYQG